MPARKCWPSWHLFDPRVNAAHASTLDEALSALLAEGYDCMGEVALSRTDDSGYALCHRDDASRPARELKGWSRAEDAEEIARYDDAGAYRPLKTAPNLCHGWRLELSDLPTLRLALECLYPGRLGAFLQWRQGRLEVTSLRETLSRQTGMYRVTQKIDDEQAVAMVGRFCRSDGGCARTILWPLSADRAGSLRSVLPAEKFDPERDQILAVRKEVGTGRFLPLLCQEACNLLVAEARAVVKGSK